MDPAEWLKEFRTLHQTFVDGKLSDADVAVYMRGREQLARSLVAAQGLHVPPNETARQAFRIRHAFQVDLTMALANARVATHDISRGGFSCILAKTPDPNEDVKFVLKLPGGATPLEGAARMVTAVKQVGNHRVSFRFLQLSDGELDRLETVLFTAALSRMP